jgi:hypothetical protein
MASGDSSVKGGYPHKNSKRQTPIAHQSTLGPGRSKESLENTETFRNHVFQNKRKHRTMSYS